jgi:hypothetical protein
MKKIVAVLALLLLSGCATYAKVERDGCKATVRGYFFAHGFDVGPTTECRPQEDR